MKIKEELDKILEKYPGLTKVVISYNGSGDSFDSFWATEFEGAYPNEDNFLESINDFLWKIIERLGAGFDNDGSEGEITIDFVNYTVNGTNNWYETITVPNTNITWDAEGTETFEDDVEETKEGEA